MPKGIYQRPTIADRFWPKYTVGPIPLDEREPCWLWTGAVFQSGLPYGQFQMDGRPHLAHRVAWTLMHGPIPEGVRVLHRCDEPRCVNPDHLFLGTDADNMKDMAAKGRGRLQRPFNRATGERHGFARLTEDQVRAIRDLYATGQYSQTVLAQMFNVHQPQVSAIIRRKRWASTV